MRKIKQNTSGFSPIIIMVAVAVAGALSLGGGLTLKEKLFKNDQPKQELLISAHEVLQTDVEKGRITSPILGTVQLDDGTFSAYQVEDGNLENLDYQEEVEITFPNSDAGLAGYEKEIARFYLANDEIRSAVIIDRMVFMLELSDGRKYPARLIKAKVVDGEVTGEFIAQIFNPNYLISGEIKNNVLENTQIIKSQENISTAGYFIARQALQFKEQFSWNYKNTSIASVLGISTENPIFSYPEDLVSADFNEDRGSWSMGTETAVSVLNLNSSQSSSLGSSSAPLIKSGDNIINVRYQDGVVILTANQSILSSEYTLTDGSVTSSIIADGAVVEGKIGIDSVIESKIKNGAVTENKLADGSVTLGKIKDGVITSAKLASNLVFDDKDLIDLSAINHSDSSKQGLILPNVSSASPHNPSSGEGYLAFDTAGNQVIVFNGSSWVQVGSGDITGVIIGNGLTGGATSGDANIGLDVATTGTSATVSSNSGLETAGDGLSLLRGCSDNQILKWDSASSLWQCEADSGSGGGTLDIEEGDALIVSAASVVDFLATDFTISESPTGEGNISIDYNNSGITRKGQNETISGSWTFTSGISVGSTAVVTNLNADLLDSQHGAYYLNSANFTGTNWTDLTDSGDTTLHDHDGISENTSARHSAITVSDTSSVNLTLTDQLLSAAILPAGVDHDSLLNFVANEHLDWTNATSNFDTTGTIQVGTSNVTITNASGYLLESAIADGALLARLSADETVTGNWTFTNGISVGSTSVVTGLNADYLDSQSGSYYLSRTNHTGTQTVATISDFDTEVSNNTDVSANTSARHSAITVSDTSSVNLTLTDQLLSAAVLPAGVDHDSLLNYVANEHLDWTNSTSNFDTTGTIQVGTSNVTITNASGYLLESAIADGALLARLSADETVSGNWTFTNGISVGSTSVVTGLNADYLDSQSGSYYLSRTNHTGTQTVATISDFDTEVGNHADVAANTSARHSAITVSDTSSVNLTLTDQLLSAAILPAGVDHDSLLNYSVNEHIDWTNATANFDTTGTIQVGTSNVTITNASGYLLESAIADGALLARLSADETVSGNWTFTNGITVGSTSPITNLNADLLDSQHGSYYLSRTNHTGTQTVATISDFDTEVGNHTDVSANTSARHSAITVSDTSSVNLTLTDQLLSAVILPAGVDHDSLLNYVANEHLDWTNATANFDTTGTIQVGTSNVTITNASGYLLESAIADGALLARLSADETVTGNWTFTNGITVGSTSPITNLNADLLDSQHGSYYLSRTNHTGTQTASTISDFDTEVSNNTDVSANTSARHSAITVSDTSSVNLTLTDQLLSAVILPAGVDHDSLLNYVANEHLDWTNATANFDTTGTIQVGTSNVTITNASGYLLESAIADGALLARLSADETVSGNWTFTNGVTIGSTSVVTNLNADYLDSQHGSYYLDRVNHTGTQTVATISDFDTEVGNHTDVSANTSARHSAITVSDTSSVNLTLTDQLLSAAILPAGVDHDSLLNYSANEHIDWTNATSNLVTTGTIQVGTSNVTITNASGYLLESAIADGALLARLSADETVTGNWTFTNGISVGSTSVVTGLNADYLDSQSGAYYLSRTNHTGTQTVATISDFDTEVSNNSDVSANTSARHSAITVSDTSSVNLTLTDQLLSAAVLPAGVDHDSLLNYVANEHLDWTNATADLSTSGSVLASSVGIGTTDPSYALDIVGELNLTDAIRVAGDAGTNGYLLTSSAGGVMTWTNPASITGTTYSVSGALTLVGNTLGLNETLIDHDNLSGFVSNEHLDWTNATANFDTTGTIQVGTSNVTITNASGYLLESAIADGALLARLSADETVTGNWTFTNGISIGSTAVVTNLNADYLDSQSGAYYLSRTNHTGTQTASTISDFDTEVGNHTDVSANTSARHSAITVSDTSSVNLTLTDQLLSAAILPAGVDHDSLLNYSANEHIDWTNTNSNLLTSGSVLASSIGIGTTDPSYALDIVGELNITDAIRVSGDAGTSGYLLTSSAGGVMTWTNPSLIGQVYSVSGALTLVGNTLGLNETLIDHDNLSGFVSNEHLDWTNASSNFSTTGTIQVGTSNVTITNASGYLLESAIADGSLLARLAANETVSGNWTFTNGITVGSTSPVTNLNADYLDSQHGAYYLNSANFTGTNWTDLTDSGDTTLHDHDGISENTSARHSAITVSDTSSVNLTLTDQLLSAVVLPAGVDHDSLLNYVANDHIDWTNATADLSTSGSVLASSIGIGTTDPSYALDIVGELNLTDAIRVNTDAGTNGYLLTSSAGGVMTWTDPASITGTTYSVSGALTLVGDTLGLNETLIDHDNLSGFVSNEHLDWTNASSNFDTTGTIQVGTSNVTITNASGYLLESAIADGALLARLSANETVSGNWTFTNGISVGSTAVVTNLNADYLDSQSGAYYLSRTNHTGTQTASTISDFDTEVGNHTDVSANTSARHSAITVSDTSSVNLTLTDQLLSAVVLPAGVDHDSLLNYVANEHLDWTNATANFDTTGTIQVGTSNVTITNASGYLLESAIADGSLLARLSADETVLGSWTFSDTMVVADINLTNAINISGDVGTNGYVLTSSAGGAMTWTNPNTIGGSAYTVDSGLTLVGSTISLGGALTANTRVNIGSTEVLYFKFSTGNIGIGNTSPSYKLDLTGEFNLTDAIRVSGDAGTNGYLLTSSAGGAMTWTDPDSITGTTYSVANGLTLTGNTISLGGNLTGNTTITQDFAETLTFLNNGSASTIFNLASTGDFDVQDNGVSALWVGSDGYVGIGTTTPASKLQVLGTITPGANDTYDLGSNALRWQSSYIGPGTIHIGTSTSDEYTLSYDTTNDYLAFNVNGSGNPEVVFDSSGNVGIGTTAPSEKLTVSGGNILFDNDAWIGGNDSNHISWNTSIGSGYFNSSGNSYINIDSNNNDTDTKALYINKNGLDTSGTNLVTILESGNVGIGTTSPGYKLDVVGELNLTDAIRVSGDAGTNGYLLTSTAGGANTWTNPALVGQVYSIINGLTAVGNTFSLGGALTANTTITQDSAEALTFANTGTGNITFNLSSTGDFDIQDNGVSALFVRDDGTVGIGTTAPGYALDLVGEFNLTDAIRVAGSAGTSGYLLSSSGGGANTWFNPAGLYSVTNGLTLVGSTISWGGALTGNTTITQDFAESLTFLNNGSGDIKFNLASSGDFEVQDNGATALFVNSVNGNVGIGTTNPTGKFSIGPGSEFQVSSAGTVTSSNGTFLSGVGDTQTAVAFTLNTSNNLTSTGAKLFSVQNNGTEKMYLDKDGNLFVSGNITAGTGSYTLVLANKSGGTVTNRSIVIIDTSNNSSFTTTTTPYTPGAYGVVVGVGLGVANDADGDGSCDANDNCIVAVSGEAEVITKNATTVSINDFIYTSDTAGSAVSSTKQFEGLLGMVTSTAGSASGYVKILFKAQPQVTAIATLDKYTKHNIYQEALEDYNTNTETTYYDDSQNIRQGLYFDNLKDETKIDYASNTATIDTKRQIAGLWGGQTYNASSTDPLSNNYLGASDVNDSYYYDRTQSGDVNAHQDSDKETLIDLGIDPNWYNGVSLIGDPSDTLSANPNENLNTYYNGGLIKVGGTYPVGSEDGSIDIEIVSYTDSTITFNWQSLGSTFSGDQADTAVFGVSTPLIDDTSSSDTGISVTFSKSFYHNGDNFRIASWYVEPQTANDRGDKRSFPAKASIVAHDSGIDIIDSETNHLWMRLNQGTSYLLGSTIPTISSVHMVNGTLYTGTNGTSATGLYELNFTSDRAYNYDTTDQALFAGQGIANRHSASGYTSVTTSTAIVNNTVNDVSTAVIPNQPNGEVTVSGWGYMLGNDTTSNREQVNLPYKFNNPPIITSNIDGYKNGAAPTSISQCAGNFTITGNSQTYAVTPSYFQIELQVETGHAVGSSNYYCYTWTATGVVSPKQFVAVATGASGSDGGTTIINDTDGTKADILVGSQHGNILRETKVAFANNTLYSANADHSAPNSVLYPYQGVHGLQSETSWAQYNHNRYLVGYQSDAHPVMIGSTYALADQIKTLTATAGTSTIDGSSNTIYVGLNDGVSVIQEQYTGANSLDSSLTYGSVKYYTKDYISEEMVGDVRGMWPLSISGTVDASVKADTLTNNGSATNVTGIRGQGMSFNGSSQYLSCTDAACGGTSKLDTGSGNWSYGAWIKTSAATRQAIISKGTGGTYSYEIDINADGTVLNDRLQASGAGYISAPYTTQTVNDGEWHHIVSVYTKATKLETYIDGKLATVGTSPSGTDNTDSSAQFEIGRRGDGSFLFNGSIDEPFVTATDLTSDQVKRMYETGKRALETSHGTNDFKNNLDDGGDSAGGTNITKSVGVDGNGFMYVGLDGSGSDDGWVSKIDLSSDTQVDYYSTATTQPILDNDVTNLLVSYSGLEMVGSDGVGAKTMSLDANGDGTTGTYYSKTITTDNFSTAYLWVNAYTDTLDSSNSIRVYASNDNGVTYTEGSLTNTDSNQSIPEKEYYFNFPATGNQLKIKVDFARASAFSNVFLTKWGITWLDDSSVAASGANNGLYTNTSDSVASGSYIDVVHNGNTNDLLTSGWVYDDAATKWIQIDNTAGDATGGTITYTDSDGLNPRSTAPYPGGYTVHTFTSSSTFTPPVTGEVEYLVVAGGGGGSSGGGGAGGFLTGTGLAVTSQAYTVTVGGGGGRGVTESGNGSNGSSSIFASITSTGGGGGGRTGVGGAGGSSGGGAGSDSNNTAGGTGISGQGSNGGTDANINGLYPSGGGGGASEVGKNAVNTTTSGAGGAGISSSITGNATTYAGGGGGGVYSSGGTGGAGGAGGGGAGGNGGTAAGTAGTANTGGGGGGSGQGSSNAGAGGSGIVIIRYPTNSLSTYKIEQLDANTARLYNYSGSTQNLRLDVVSGTAGRNSGTVSLHPLAADTDASANGNSLWINKTGTGGNLLKLQASGSDVLALSTAGTLTLTGDFIPGTDDTYDLGSSTARWQDLYLGPASLHIGTNGNEAIMSYDTVGNFLGFDPDGGGGNPEVVILDNGNVGVGTTAPGAKLHVNGSAVITQTAGNFFGLGTGTFTGLGTTLPDYGMGYSDVGGYNTNLIGYSNLTFWTNRAERIRIDAAGYVGIGTTTPVSKLTIQGEISFKDGTGATKGYLGVSSIDGSAPASSLRIRGDDGILFSVSGAPKAFINTSGRVGIGTTAPTQMLDITAGVIIRQSLYVRHIDGKNYGTSDTNGALYLNYTNHQGIYNYGYTTFIYGHGDLAENYYVSGNVLRGALVSVNDSSASTVINSSSNNLNILGAVSTKPGAVMDVDGGFVIGSDTKAEYNNEKAPIALTGAAPVLVTSQNGIIEIGDAIGISNTPGFGAKMIKAGNIVGKALEQLDTNSCTSASLVEAINWPEDDGKNSLKPCFVLPDGTYVGKVMVAVNVSWHDPNANLTSTGDLVISQDESGDYLVTNQLDDIVIESNATFDNSVIANLRTGSLIAIEAQVESLKIGTQTLTEFIVSVVQNALDNGQLESTLISSTGDSTEPVLTQDSLGNITLGDTNTNVGIGVTNPVYKLQVGTENNYGFVNEMGAWSVANNIASSDIEITNLENSLAKILTLEPIRFNNNIGFNANDLEITFPELVSTDPNTGIKGISYSLLTPVLVKGMQEQQLLITGNSDALLNVSGDLTTQEQEIASLEQRIRGLEDWRIGELDSLITREIDSRIAGIATGSSEIIVVGMGEDVNGVWEVLQESIFKFKTSFIELVEFMGDVVFKGKLTVNKDTAGIVKLKSGETSVVVEFSKEFSNTPVIVVTRRGEAELNNFEYSVINESLEGFAIVINQPQISDLEFSWYALAVENLEVIEGNPLPIEATDSAQLDASASAIN